MYWSSNTGTQGFTNGPEHTIQGSGRIHALLTNNGLVTADRNGQLLELLTTTKTNNGQMLGTNGGILRFNGITVNQNGTASLGTNGGTLDLLGTTVNGGFLQMSGGTCRVLTGSALNSVTLQGPVDIANGTSLTIGGTGLLNHGDIDVSDGAGGSACSMQAAGDMPLTGSGSVRLQATTNLETAALYWFNNSGSQRFINGPDHTIHGTGNIHVRLDNQGLLAADVPGRTLQLLTTNKTNSGAMIASNGGTLAVNSVVLDNTPSGSITTSNGLFHSISAAINNAVITTPLPNGSTRISGTNTFTNCDFAGRMNIDNGSSFRVGGSYIINDGSIHVNDGAGGSGTYFQSTGNQSLLGNGEIVLNATGNLETAAIYWTSNATTHTFVNGPDHTIRGTGNIHLTLTNQGEVLADRPASVLQLLSNNKTNSGLMKATNGGTLQINGIAVNQTGAGQIATDGGSLSIVSSAISGGPINVAPANPAVFSGTNTLTQVTINGDTSVPNGSSLRMAGTGITNNGNIRVNDGVSGSATSFNSTGACTLSGTGSLELDAAPANLDTAYVQWVANSTTNTLTNAATHTIKGSGNIYLTTTNNGLITADKPGRTLQLLNNTKINNNTIRAENTGTLTVTGIAVNQDPAARIEAIEGNLVFSSATVTGGTIDVDSLSTSTVVGTSSFNSVTHTGETRVNDGAVLFINSEITNDGNIRVNGTAGGSLTALRTGTSGTALLGTGSIELNANPGNLDTAYMQWSGNSTTNTFVNGALHTIKGCGNIYLTLTNLGTLSADKPGRTLQLLNNNKVNEGLMNTANGGTLQFNGIAVTQQNAGRIQASGGNIAVVNAAIIDGPVSSSPGFAINSSGTSGISNITFSGTWNVTNASTLGIAAAGITNNGVIRLNDGASGGSTFIRSEGATAFRGTGTLLLDANPTNLDTGYLIWTNNSSTQTFTNGPSHTIAGTGRIYTIFSNSGILSPGSGSSAVGVIDLRGPSTLTPSSIARFKIGGTAANQFDRIIGNSSITLNGTLRGSFFGAFSPTVNDSFTIISGPSIAGEFSRIELPKGWWVEYGSNFVRVHYSGCIADWNYSGGVDGDDVIAFFDLWDVNDIGADVNLDGGVDGNDVIEFFFRWDNGC
jgi:hypothetical protein